MKNSVPRLRRGTREGFLGEAPGGAGGHGEFFWRPPACGGGHEKKSPGGENAPQGKSFEKKSPGGAGGLLVLCAWGQCFFLPSHARPVAEVRVRPTYSATPGSKVVGLFLAVVAEVV